MIQRKPAKRSMMIMIGCSSGMWGLLSVGDNSKCWTVDRHKSAAATINLPTKVLLPRPCHAINSAVLHPSSRVESLPPYVLLALPRRIFRLDATRQSLCYVRMNSSFIWAEWKISAAFHANSRYATQDAVSLSCFDSLDVFSLLEGILDSRNAFHKEHMQQAKLWRQRYPNILGSLVPDLWEPKLLTVDEYATKTICG